NILYYTLLIVVAYVISIDTLPAKQPSKQPPVSCEANRQTLYNFNRLPSYIDNLTCHQNPQHDCYSAFGSVMVVDKTSRNMGTLSVVVACLRRVTCQKKNIKIQQYVDASSNVVYKISCNKPEEEISIMLPTKIMNGQLVYKKVVYDCRCSCSGT
ncbi:Hypothetical predicted protein, partial [Paramuricea clavata]